MAKAQAVLYFVPVNNLKNSHVALACSYQGKLKLTMTGTWDIHLHVKDAAGNTVAGGEELSDLYLTVII